MRQGENEVIVCNLQNYQCRASIMKNLNNCNVLLYVFISTYMYMITCKSEHTIYVMYKVNIHYCLLLGVIHARILVNLLSKKAPKM